MGARSQIEVQEGTFEVQSNCIMANAHMIGMMNSIPIVKCSDIYEGQDYHPETHWLEDDKYKFTEAHYCFSRGRSMDVSHLREKLKSESFTVNEVTMGGDPNPGGDSSHKFLKVTFKRGDPKLDFGEGSCSTQ